MCFCFVFWWMRTHRFSHFGRTPLRKWPWKCFVRIQKKCWYCRKFKIDLLAPSPGCIVKCFPSSYIMTFDHVRMSTFYSTVMKWLNEETIMLVFLSVTLYFCVHLHTCRVTQSSTCFGIINCQIFKEEFHSVQLFAAVLNENCVFMKNLLKMRFCSSFQIVV